VLPAAGLLETSSSWAKLAVGATAENTANRAMVMARVNLFIRQVYRRNDRLEFGVKRDFGVVK
jgi:hypothetical protein